MQNKQCSLTLKSKKSLFISKIFSIINRKKSYLHLFYIVLGEREKERERALERLCKIK